MKSAQIDKIFQSIKQEIPEYHHDAVFKSLYKCNTPLLDLLEKRFR